MNDVPIFGYKEEVPGITKGRSLVLQRRGPWYYKGDVPSITKGRSLVLERRGPWYYKGDVPSINSTSFLFSTSSTWAAKCELTIQIEEWWILNLMATPPLLPWQWQEKKTRNSINNNYNEKIITKCHNTTWYMHPIRSHDIGIWSHDYYYYQVSHYTTWYRISFYLRYILN